MLIYKIPPDSFAAYARLPAAQVEARADALRFDAILEAAGKYLADGHDLSKISALELKRLDLLPPDWRVNPPPAPIPTGKSDRRPAAESASSLLARMRA